MEMATIPKKKQKDKKRLQGQERAKKKKAGE